jgi:O-antigen ligase
MTFNLRIPSNPPLLVARHGDEPRSLGASRLEVMTMIHVAGLLVFTAWDFGGETDFARLVISWWGSLALPLTALACLRRFERHEGLPAALHWLWPLLGFDSLVLLSTLNPSFTYALIRGVRMLVAGGAKPGWPSSALPKVSLRALWEFNAIFLTCFNLAVVVIRRRVLRALLFILIVNALVLAVMGTFQKLAGATGLYFGLQRSPNIEFFATFIYHNHWAAFVLLNTAGALGLLFHHARHPGNNGERHSPVLFGLVVTLFLAAAAPMSTSRSGSLLVFALLAGALLHWLRRLVRARRSVGRSPAAPMALVVAVFLGGLAGIYLLSRPIIDRRVDNTRQQLEAMRLRGDLGNRTQLYGDTWRMAREKICFGWGLGTYGTVFQMFNQQVSVEGWVPFYAEAHSDWLQALAEVGFVGTALLVLLGAMPLAATLRLGPPGPVPAYLLAGCGMVALYALVEFPFANPAVQEAFWFCFFTAVRYHKLNVSAA